MKRIEGGQEGIQYISKGSQQFATEGNFLFITTNETKQSFHVKTIGGIILENKKNKIHIQENGIRSDLLYLEQNIQGDNSVMIGGNYLLSFVEKKSEYHLQMNRGQIKQTDFSKYQIIGDTFEIDVAKFLIKRGDYGIDWENDLILSNPSQIKFMSLNGDINFSTKNGERIFFNNEKPNGAIEFNAERSIIKTQIAKMEHNSLHINCPNIQLNKNIIIEEDCIDVELDTIKLKAEKIEIGCIKIKDNNFGVKIDEIQFIAGESKLDVTKNKISLIGDGNLGIMLIGEKAGIKILGDLQWICKNDLLIQTDNNQKILKIGADPWKLKLEGEVEIENCTLIGKNKRVFGELCEIFGESSLSWHIRESIGRVNLNGFSFESGQNQLEITSKCIREKGVKKIIQFEEYEEIGICKKEKWENSNGEWEELNNKGVCKNENWDKCNENIKNYLGIIQKYELIFDERNGIYWDGELFEIRGVFKKNNMHTIFCGENKLVIENNEVEILNCLLWKNNELVLGVGKRFNNISISEDAIIFGGKLIHLKAFDNKIDLGGSIFINTYKQVFIGDLIDDANFKDRKIIISLKPSSILLDEKQIHFMSKKMYLFGSDLTQISGKIIQLQGESIAIGSSETEYIELRGEKIVYKKKNTQFELDESFLFVREGKGGSLSKLYIGKNCFLVESDDAKFQWGVNIKAEVNIHSMRNINIESTIGNILIKNYESQIFMNHEEKLLGIWSEENISVNANKLMMNGEKIEMNFKNFTFDTKTDIDIRFGRKLEILGGKEVEVQCKDGIKILSDLFGEIRIGKESEINIQNSLDFKIGENYLVNINGGVKYSVEKDVKFYGGKTAEFKIEDEIKICTDDLLNIEAANIILKSKNIGMNISENINLTADKIILGAKEIIFQQRGFGEISWEADGKIRMVSKIEGNRGDVMEIRAESNTHEKSIHICSRIGGIYLEGQTIGLGGKVQINGVEIVGGENRLSVGAMVEASGLKIGKNMFIEPRGISLLQREEVEFRNMDLKLGGRLDVESLKVKKILGGTEVEGKMRVIGGIECKGGIMGDGVRLGNWDGGNRSCLKIEMKGTVWNEGINISGGGRSIVVDGDIVCSGGGRILAHSPREGRQDIGKLLEEVAAMGDSGAWDVGRALQKLAAIVGILAAEKEE